MMLMMINFHIHGEMKLILIHQQLIQIIPYPATLAIDHSNVYINGSCWQNTYNQLLALPVHICGPQMFIPNSWTYQRVQNTVWTVWMCFAQARFSEKLCFASLKQQTLFSSFANFLSLQLPIRTFVEPIQVSYSQ